ncbi:MAG: 16S rRNA processing protein RimM [Proteobacteria bacterium]|nr:16S rRNA processing protein RimM [Pseudomonadota bacterium]
MGDTSDKAPALIELATIGAPFGVRGWVKVRSHIDPPERLFEFPVWSIVGGAGCERFTVLDLGRSAGQLTVKLAGVDDREAAGRLRGARVCVLRDELPAPRAGEFFRADLIGFEVRDLAGQVLGTLEYFVDSPAHALMMVTGPRRMLIPAVPSILRRVDVAARQLVVDWA